MGKSLLNSESRASASPRLNTWDQLAKLDPLGIILHDPDKNHGRWGLDEFFLTGEVEASSVLDKCQECGLPLKYGSALDFGCGVGRLTRAFASRFSHCVGIDVSAEMVSRARKFNERLSNCEFVVNRSHQVPFPDQSFDFVYSFLVLMHLQTKRDILNWILEFTRILRPGGALVFQLPDKPSLRRRIQVRRRLWSLLQSLGVPERFLYENLRLHPIRMNGIPPDQVRKALESAGVQVIRIEEDGKAGAHFRSYSYFALKRDSS